MPTYNANLAAARALAQTLFGFDLFAAATDDVATKALNTATLRIDAGKYQGRKYALDQVKEFPRVDASSEGSIDDWDSVNRVAVVPETVRLAEIFEAQSIIGNEFDRIQEAIAAGLAGQTTGSLSETYRQSDAGAAQVIKLCPGAARLMHKYRLRTGSLA